MAKAQLGQALILALAASNLVASSAIAVTAFGNALIPVDTTGNNRSGDVTHNMGSNPQGSTVPNEIITTPDGQFIAINKKTAVQLAKYESLDKAAAANPRIIAAICCNQRAARILAAHRHIDKIANADHYLCRRLTRWPDAADIMVHNPRVARVLQLDPQGIYYAIAQNPNIGRILAGHVEFADMCQNDPNLPNVIAAHMR